jgi:uncharacterized protein involved in exopolysaccharide biosynthesis
MRSNMQQAANDEAGRQVDINNQEVARQDAINMQNNQLTNNAKGINLELKNQYNEIDEANKGAKEGLIQAGLAGLGQLGARNILYKNQRNAQEAELKSIASNSNYEFVKDNKGEYTILKFKDGSQMKVADFNKLPKQDQDKKTGKKN